MLILAHVFKWIRIDYILYIYTVSLRLQGGFVIDIAYAADVVAIGTRYQRKDEAEARLIERLALSATSDLSDEEYAQKAIELRAKERAWAKRWKIG